MTELERQLSGNSQRRGWLQLVMPLAVTGLATPYLLLVLLSLGSGWAFPGLLPDRIDFAPWRSFWQDHDGLRRALFTSLGISLLVAVLATFTGLLVGRLVRLVRSRGLYFLIYLPFVICPVVAATSLYDLLIRLKLAGTLTGVLLSQLIFTTSFSSVFFSELWSQRTDRMETLVRSLGGGTWDVWRHVVLPQRRGLIAVCLIQTALFSWLDYGLVSIIGGGRVTTLTLKLFSFLREASVNQAAMSALVLLLPVLIFFHVVVLSDVYRRLRL